MARRNSKKRHYFRSRHTPQFGCWQPETFHEHDYETVSVTFGGKTIIIDKCKTCPHESARDLI